MRSRLPNKDIAVIRDWFLEKPYSVSELHRRTGMSRGAIQRHCDAFAAYELLHPGRLKNRTNFRVYDKPRKLPPNLRYDRLLACLLGLLATSQLKRNGPKKIYKAYLCLHPDGYSFDGFRPIYRKWRKENKVCVFGHNGVKHISEEDSQILDQWRKGSNLEKWRKAVVIQGSAQGMPLVDLREKVEIGLPTLHKWIKAFNERGTAGLYPKPHLFLGLKARVKEKQERLSRILHESPKLHDFNRTTWRLEDLAAAYQKTYSEPMSMTTARMCIKKMGFKFKKAKMVLTSPDPEFRPKLERIQNILRNLQLCEKFFSMDEFGPFAVKMKPGWQYLPQNEIKLVPQVQKSKGFLICTAAVELSTNQVSHFYSLKKNTDEMIKLIELLISQYPNDRKLYISGDACSWHSSVKLQDHLDRVNGQAEMGKGPKVEWVNLPSSAQFLNVIESIFSGLSKAVIQNSDYGSLDDCKAAIDRHFSERNDYFRKHPKKAGNKIWGQETTKPRFHEANNCKDARAHVWLH